MLPGSFWSSKFLPTKQEQHRQENYKFVKTFLVMGLNWGTTETYKHVENFI